MRRCLVLVALLPLAGCGGPGRAATASPAAKPVVSVGRPTTPRRVPIQQGGTIELLARSPSVRLAVLRAAGGDPRDDCVAVLPG